MLVQELSPLHSVPVIPEHAWRSMMSPPAPVAPAIPPDPPISDVPAGEPAAPPALSPEAPPVRSSPVPPHPPRPGQSGSSEQPGGQTPSAAQDAAASLSVSPPQAERIRTRASGSRRACTFWGAVMIAFVLSQTSPTRAGMDPATQFRPVEAPASELPSRGFALRRAPTVRRSICSSSGSTEHAQLAALPDRGWGCPAAVVVGLPKWDQLAQGLPAGSARGSSE